MSEVLWWKKESWYEAKSIPLFGFFVSPRQLAFVLASGLFGFILQTFLPGYSLKVAAVFVFVAAGGALSSVRSNVVPWELAILAGLLWHEKRGRARAEPRSAFPSARELNANVPLALVGELRVEKPTDVVLYVDGTEVARTTVTSEKPRYRLYYMPDESQRGAHEIRVVAEGRTVDRLEVEVE